MGTARPSAAVVTALVASVLFGRVASSHDFESTRGLLLIRSDRSFQLDLTLDLDALALGVDPSTDAQVVVRSLGSLGPREFDALVDRLRHSLTRRVRVSFDGVRGEPAVSFPDRENGAAARSEVPTVLGVTARFEGVVPDRAEAVSVRISRALPGLHLTVVSASRLEGLREVVERGAESTPFRLSGGQPLASGDERLWIQHLWLGVVHIVPRGWDHMAFVLGLFFAAPGWRRLLVQVSAFTIAHSVTLGLAATGRVPVVPDFVEPVIAASICYVAVENVRTAQPGLGRTILVFAFGLVHGLGFAGALGALGLPPGAELASLVAFNVGVEFGQLGVLAAGYACVGWWRREPWFRPRIAIPASLAIGFAGLYWLLYRLFGL